MPVLRTPQSLGEGMQQARVAAGFSNVDDAAEAAGVSRDFVYQIERIGNRPNAANPTLSVLRSLADVYGVELGDCFPATKISTEEVREIFDALSFIPAENRRKAVMSIASFIRTMADGMAATSDPDHAPIPNSRGYNPASVIKSTLHGDDAVGFVGPTATGALPRQGHDEPDTGRRKAEGSKKRRDRDRT